MMKSKPDSSARAARAQLEPIACQSLTLRSRFANATGTQVCMMGCLPAVRPDAELLEPTVFSPSKWTNGF